jgi:hypothetical protein
LSANEERAEINEMNTKFRKVNLELKNNCNEPNLGQKRIKINSSLELQGINN